MAIEEVLRENKGGLPEAAAPGLRSQIAQGDLVLLWFDDEVSYLIEVIPGKKVGIHCGKPLDAGSWIGRRFGEPVASEHGRGYLLKPTMEDLMMKASRESGIIYPKDAAFLMIKSGISSGAKVLEIGTGSGSLTLALAQAVAPTGCVWTYDRREDLPKNARRNIARAGLGDYVVFGQRASCEPIPEGEFDAAILDIPTPWDEVDAVRRALKSGGRIVSLNPTFNQIEKMAEALRRHGFLLVECRELLERPILALEGKTRPVQRMVSHTEFMVFGVRPSDPEAGSGMLPAGADETAG